jgi:tetratricopeptide (TPR) repeat protein
VRREFVLAQIFVLWAHCLHAQVSDLLNSRGTDQLGIVTSPLGSALQKSIDEVSYSDKHDLASIYKGSIQRQILEEACNLANAGEVELQGILPLQQASRHFSKAHRFYLTSAFNDAVYWYTQSENKFLSNQQLVQKNFEMAYAYLQINKKTGRQIYSTEDIVSLMNAIRQIDGVYKQAGNYYYAVLQYLNGDFSEALLGLQAIENNNRYGSAVPFIRAQCYYELGRITDAQAEINKYFTTHLTNARYGAQMVRLAMQIAYEEQKYDKVVEFGRKISDPLAMDDVQRYNYAYAAMQLEDFEVARAAFRSLLRNANDTLVANVYCHLAQMALAEKSYGEAISNLKFVADDAPISTEQQLNVWYNLMALFYGTGDTTSTLVYSMRLARVPKSHYYDEAVGTLCAISQSEGDQTLAIDRLQEFRGIPRVQVALHEI